MNDIKNYIGRNTKYNVALNLLKENGFTEVYSHEFENHHKNYEGVKEHLHIFYKYSVVITLETFGGNVLNSFNVYVEYRKPQGYDKRANSQDGRGISMVYNFPYNVFDFVELLYEHDRIVTNWKFRNGNKEIKIMDCAETNSETGKFQTSSIFDGTKQQERNKRFMTMPKEFLEIINYLE